MPTEASEIEVSKRGLKGERGVKEGLKRDCSPGEYIAFFASYDMKERDFHYCTTIIDPPPLGGTISSTT